MKNWARCELKAGRLHLCVVRPICFDANLQQFERNGLIVKLQIETNYQPVVVEWKFALRSCFHEHNVCFF